MYWKDIIDQLKVIIGAKEEEESNNPNQVCSSCEGVGGHLTTCYFWSNKSGRPPIGANYSLVQQIKKLLFQLGKCSE
jgi:hypothetical protein